MVSEKRGRYRIQAVVEATGVSAPTLRSWERRYGVPTPQRTAAAYRLYSEDDIALISRMRDLTGRGVAAAEAAHAVRAPVIPRALVAVDPFDDARDHMVRAVKAFEPTAIEHAVLRAFTLADATTVYDRVISQAMAMIEEARVRGDMSIAQERLAAEATTAVVRDALRLVQPVDSTRSIVLACFAGDHHVIGLYGIGLRFAGWGFRTLSLGPDNPPRAVADAVKKLRPDLVGLSLAPADDADAARALVSGYAEACGTTPWIIGGSGAFVVRDAVTAQGGIIADHDIVGVRALVERTLRHIERSA